MGFRETVKKEFANGEKILAHRYRSSKTLFVVMTFLFCLNFFLVGAGFHTSITSVTLSYIYIVLLLSLIYYLFFLMSVKLGKKLPQWAFNSILVVGIIFILTVLSPIAFEGGILSFISF